MNWFQLSDSLILPFHYQSEAYHYALTHQLPITGVRKLRIKRCSISQFLALIEQILHYTEQGHSLQSALLTQQTHRLSSRAQQAMRIVVCQLAQGVGIGAALALVVPDKAATLVALIPEHGTEESKIAALNITRQALHQQSQLSQRLIKCLTYPYTLIQSAMGLALVNVLLTDGSPLAMCFLWSCLTLLQGGFYVWVKVGSAYPFIVRHCKSFRIHSVLTLLIALLNSGEPLQRALQTLLNDTNNKERPNILRALLMLQRGANAGTALPSHWFLDFSASLLNNADQTGELTLALNVAADEWQARNQTLLTLITKLSPIIGMLIASIFVAYTLLKLYAPLMETSNVVI